LYLFLDHFGAHDDVLFGPLLRVTDPRPLYQGPHCRTLWVSTMTPILPYGFRREALTPLTLSPPILLSGLLVRPSTISLLRGTPIPYRGYTAKGPPLGGPQGPFWMNPHGRKGPKTPISTKIDENGPKSWSFKVLNTLEWSP